MRGRPLRSRAQASDLDWLDDSWAVPDPLFIPADERLLSRTFDKVEALEAKYGVGCPQGQALLIKVSRKIERAAARRLGLA